MISLPLADTLAVPATYSAPLAAIAHHDRPAAAVPPGPAAVATQTGVGLGAAAAVPADAAHRVSSAGAAERKTEREHASPAPRR